MRAVVLGSGQDGGVPQLFGPDRSERTASSLAVVTSAGTVLIDCSPDIRRQHRFLTRIVGVEPSRVVAVALTHGHMGHYSGLVHFGREAAATSAIPVHATKAMLEFLTGNEPWARLFEDGHLTATEPWFEYGDVRAEAISVPHRSEFTDTVAWSLRSPDLSILYLPDIDSWDQWPEAVATIARHDVALVDATFYDTNEPVGRSMDDIPHPLVVDTIERFGSVASRIILTHLNHTNALVRGDEGATTAVQAAGFEVAYDGMVIE